VKNFRAFLRESPYGAGMDYGDLLDNLAFNAEEAQELVQSKPEDFIADFGVSLYREEGDIIEDKFTDDLIRAYFQYRKTADTLHFKGIWNARHAKGLCFRLLFSYYLPHYHIVSDQVHSTQGERFWRRCIKEAEARGNRWAVLEDGQEIQAPLDDIWGSEERHFARQLKLFRVGEK
jgi:hypothetical protein